VCCPIINPGDRARAGIVYLCAVFTGQHTSGNRQLARHRLRRISAERRMEFLTQLGKDVEIRIGERPARRSGLNPSLLIRSSYSHSAQDPSGS
jgi:hypothetical protein